MNICKSALSLPIVLLLCASTASPPTRVSPAAAGRIEPSAKARAWVESLAGADLGVDRRGNLWVWSLRKNTVEILSRTGDVLARHAVPADAQAVDADSEWGILAVVDMGNALVWQPWESEPRRVSLPEREGDVVWWEAGKAALSPQANAARVEIWGLAEKARLASWGQETLLKPGFGATRLRAVMLRVDTARRRLYALETYTGEMQVFDGSGQLLWSRSVENPMRKDSDVWLAEVDRKAKAERDVQTPRLQILSFALAEDGAAWVVQSVLEGPPRKVQLARISPKGEVAPRVVEEPCPSATFTLWGDWVIFVRGRDVPGGPCAVIRRF